MSKGDLRPWVYDIHILQQTVATPTITTTFPSVSFVVCLTRLFFSGEQSAVDSYFFDLKNKCKCSNDVNSQIKPLLIWSYN